MRTWILITLLAQTYFATAQQSFYDVYNSTAITYAKYMKDLDAVDSLKNVDYLKKESLQTKLTTQYLEEMDKLPQKLHNLYFPDINFSDINHKSMMISDLEGELVINYNYPYCMKCISLIDSTQKRTDKSNIKILVLFTEIYRKDVSSLLKSYNENVYIGFITFDTRDLISLKQGDDSMYFLDKDHRIEFFEHRDHKAWAKFLDSRLD